MQEEWPPVHCMAGGPVVLNTGLLEEWKINFDFVNLLRYRGCDRILS